MRINRNETIAGLDVLRVRNALRAQHRQPFDPQDLADALKVPKSKALEVIEALRARGWLQTAEQWGRPKDWQTTLEGNAFTVAHATKPIPRAKADKLLAEFLKRVEEVNANDEYGYYVHEVHLFGSYLGDAAEVGDIDLAVDLRFRAMGDRDVVDHSIARARASGRRFKLYIEMLGYSEIEVRRILKARSPYISLHDMQDIEVTGAQARLIYEAKRA
jgi:predicted nucleotidyltransferase